MTMISVSHLSKRYASYASNLERFATWFGAPFAPTEVFWPVKDISFSLQAGEALAIVGQNGAGKSTLLKLITGTVRSTEGSIQLGGRVGAILELGLGFNPELTGRQNVMLAGGLMGLSTRRIVELIPEIESFAEIGDFFDRPFRVYSSGMQARLAFSLVTAERPDILIVDEVLSVGDTYFQHKSFERIRKFKEQGSAIMLVTHSLGDVVALCDRAILLDKGVNVREGMPDEVIDFYNAMIAAKENTQLTVEQRRTKEGWSYTRSGNFQVAVQSLDLRDAQTGNLVQTATVGQDLILEMTVRSKTTASPLVFGLMLRDRTGHLIWGTNTWHTRQVIHGVEAGETIVCRLAFKCTLGQGSYSFSPALTNSETHLDINYEWIDNALVFEVLNMDRPFFIGTNALDGTFEITRSQIA